MSNTVAQKTAAFDLGAMFSFLRAHLAFLGSAGGFELDVALEESGKTGLMHLQSLVPLTLMAFVGAAILFRRSGKPATLVPMMFVVVHRLVAGIMNPVGNLWERYMPAEYLAVCIYLAYLSTAWVPAMTKGGPLLRPHLIGPILAVAYSILLVSDYGFHIHAYNAVARYFYKLDYRIGEWLHDHSAPGDTIAVFEAGGIAFFSDRRVVDMGGVTEYELAPAIREHRLGQILLEKNVDFVAPFGDDCLSSEGIDFGDGRYFDRIPLPSRGLFRVRKQELRTLLAKRH